MLIDARRGWLTALAVMVVVAVSQDLSAQSGGGRGESRGRFFGGRMVVGSPIGLAAMDEVQDALKLTDEQREKIDEINDQFRDDIRELLQDGAGRDAMRELSQDAAKKLADVLNDKQERRLRGITIQVAGANAVLADKALAKELAVTAEQKEKLEGAQRENMRTIGEAFREMRDSDLSREEHREKFSKLRADAEERLLAVLTDEQRTQLESLKGEKVEIDTSRFRGRGGRGDFDRRRARVRESRGDRTGQQDKDARDSSGEGDRPDSSD